MSDLLEMERNRGEKVPGSAGAGEHGSWGARELGSMGARVRGSKTHSFSVFADQSSSFYRSLVTDSLIPFADPLYLLTHYSFLLTY